MMKLSCCVVGLVSLAAVATAVAADWPEYRGPNHNGIVVETIKAPFPDGLKPLWTAPTPDGFSSFAIGGGDVFTIVGEGGKEVTIALDAKTGKQLWATPTGMEGYMQGGDSGANGNKGGDGPRSTPAYSDGKIYVNSSNLGLYCLDAKTGKPTWVIDLISEYGGRNIGWGNAASPVIDGKLLFVAAGGANQSLLAIDKETGKPVWKSGTESITHATPVITDILGQHQVVFFMQSGLLSVEPTTGKLLWKYKFDYSTSTAASPVVCGDIVYCSAGYDTGAGACKIAKDGAGFTATEVWRVRGNKTLANHWSTPIYKDGCLYGIFGFKRYGVGPMKCVDVATGKVKWEQAGFGAGQVILAGDKLVALADDGQVILVDPQPTGYKELARMQAVNGKCWSTPALADGHLFVRSTKEAACYEVGQ